MTPLFIDAWPDFTDAGEERPAQPRGGDHLSVRRLSLFLALSLTLHILTAALALGFSILLTGGGGASEPQVMMISLGGAVDTQPDGARPIANEAAAEELAEISEASTPEPDIMPEKPVPPPDLEAINLSPPERKISRPEPRSSLASPKITARGEGRPKEAAGQGDGGPAASAGSGRKGAGEAGSAAGYLKGNYEYIKKRIRQHLVYSPQAKRMGIQGTVTVSFAIEKDGSARNITVSKTSGHEGLDESALKAVRNASPFPPPPATARIVVPISFSLK
jgi:protein TonB